MLALFGGPGGGASAVFGPDGTQLSTDLDEKEESLVYADLDFNLLLMSKPMLDICGHYSRPDLLWLGVEYRKKKDVRPDSNEPPLTRV